MFEELIGQQQAIELLTASVKQNRIAPAYLFAGTDGVGRSLAATCFIRLLFAGSRDGEELSVLKNRVSQRNHPDLFWVEPTYQYQGERLTAAQAAEKKVKRKAPPVIRLEQIREISQFLSRPPLESVRSVVVIEQAEAMAESAANALLKTLEEPGRATLILIAPSPESILPTLVSRCQKIPFYRLDSSSLTQVLTRTGNLEILQHPEILNLAAGSPGSAILAHQQLQSINSQLLQEVKKLPTSYLHALELGKRIDRELDTEGQLWLIEYLQQYYWQKTHKPQIIQELEKTRKNLLCYAQPQLVWECTFLAILRV